MQTQLTRLLSDGVLPKLELHITESIIPTIHSTIDQGRLDLLATTRTAGQDSNAEENVLGTQRESVLNVDHNYEDGIFGLTQDPVG